MEGCRRGRLCAGRNGDAVPHAGGREALRPDLAMRRRHRLHAARHGVGCAHDAGAMPVAQGQRKDVLRPYMPDRLDRQQSGAALQRPLPHIWPVRRLRARHFAHRLHLPAAEDRRACRHRLSRLRRQGPRFRRLQDRQADAERDLRAGRRKKFDTCVATNNFDKCLGGAVNRGNRPACSADHFCREDYMCQSLPPDTPGAAKVRGIGFCSPTYHLPDAHRQSCDALGERHPCDHGRRVWRGRRRVSLLVQPSCE
ncbi:hypothetical protein MESS4_580046 [Mesorhizobium sp. STM 4661]|nr:hypothetical protein MESS4_580046 [Mesorhizobium sp. STM 4661]